MEAITISKTKYNRLLSMAKAYEKPAGSIFENVIKDPVSDIVTDFKKTNLYTTEFLKDLEDGLKKIISCNVTKKIM